MRCFWPIQSLFVQIEFIFKFLFILCPLLTKVRHHLVHLVLQENALFPFHPFSYSITYLFIACLLLQGGSNISGTLSKLHHCIKKSYFSLILSRQTVSADCPSQIKINRHCAADFSLLNLPKGKSLGRSKPATNS